MQRLQQDSNYASEARRENDMLKNELQIMRQQLQRLEPNGPHVYGHFTSQLSQAPQANGAPPPISLPPLSADRGHGGPSYGNGAMQGVEYGYGR